MEIIELGSSPCDEDCAYVGVDGYAIQAKKECLAYCNQIERMIDSGDIPPMPFGARLSTKSFPHDFGSYYEVVVYCDDNDSINWAYDLESILPAYWDNEARKELGIDVDSIHEVR